MGLSYNQQNKNKRSNYQKKKNNYKNKLNIIHEKTINHPTYSFVTTNEKKKLDLIKNRLQVLSSKGWFNKFYKGQKKILENNPQSINTVLQELQLRLNEKYSRLQVGKRKARKEFLEETIKLLRQHTQTAGSKKRRRRQKVKGKRVLKNGTLAGYVKQADGSWRWRFLPK